MRTLKFNVQDQIITRDPNCDFSNLVPGTEGYLQAEFTFSKEWDSCSGKVAAFYSPIGVEFPPQIIKNNTCMIPAEACARRNFMIKVIGKGADGYRLTTNDVLVTQTGGAV